MSREKHSNGNGNEFVIRKDVPVPIKGPRGRFPFGEMEVGESFEVPTAIKRFTAANAVYSYNKMHAPKRFTFGRWPEGNGKTYGCWRVK